MVVKAQGTKSQLHLFHSSQYSPTAESNGFTIVAARKGTPNHLRAPAVLAGSF